MQEVWALKVWAQGSQALAHHALETWVLTPWVRHSSLSAAVQSPFQRPKASQRRRLDTKIKRGQIKALRGKVDDI